MAGRVLDTIRRSFGEFLALPFISVFVFLAMAWGATAADEAAGPPDSWNGFHHLLGSFVGDADQANNLMSTVASSLVTMSSITFSILLLAVQQSSAALTNQVVDQYMRRRTNQAFFGFFVGSSLFALISLGLAKHEAVPVFAASISMLLTILCLLALVALIYSTLDQTRPSAIIATIHDATVSARNRQIEALARVHVGHPGLSGGRIYRSQRFGYLSRVDHEVLNALCSARPGRTVVIEVPTGASVCHGQELVTVFGPDVDPDEERRLRKALHVTRRRELQWDPAFGIDQLGNIGWTAVSTAKSNPAAGLITIEALNDLLFRWGFDGSLESRGDRGSRVYVRDAIMDHMACAYESLMVVASESLQQQCLAEVSKGVARAFGHLPTAMQDKLERAVVGSLSALGDHVPTDVLCKEIERLGGVFRDNGRIEAADKLSAAWEKLARSRGVLHSRSDRVPSN